MDLTQQQSQTQHFLHTLYAKCWEDEGFKNQLITSPQDAIREFVGTSFEVPSNVEFVVTDQSAPNRAYINIPAKPDMTSLELSDEQLELVAGGEVLVTAGLFLASMSISLGVVGIAAGVYYATH